MTRHLLSCACVAVLASIATPAFATPAPIATPVHDTQSNPGHDADLHREPPTHLTGDWGGLRTDLMARGLTLDLIYTVDLAANVSGGKKRGGDYLDNTDLTLEIDGEKLYGIEGSRAFIYVLGNNGPDFNANRVGAGEGVNNIEVSTSTYKLYEAWLEQDFWGDLLSLRGGLYDLNAEFNVTESSGVFINPTYGIDTAYSATGDNGPSIFPTTALGLRAMLRPTDETYVMAAMLDGVAGDPDDAHGTQISLGNGDGALYALEAGYGEVSTGRVAVGGWRYSERADDTDGNGGKHHQTGWYVMGEKTLYSPAEGRHLDGFVRFTHGRAAVADYDYNGSFGVSYTGPFANRPDDVAGLAWHGAHLSDSARAADPSLISTGEWGIEATYAYAATGWLTVQPDLQYVANPGSDGTDDAWVTTLRMAVAF